MVGVQDFVKCPQCGFERAIYELQTRTMEEYLLCPYCGCNRYIRTLIDRVKSKQINDGNEYFKLRKDSKLTQRLYKHQGFGAYSTRNIKGAGSLGGFRKTFDLQKLIQEEQKSQGKWHFEYITKADGANVEVVHGEFKGW